MKKFKSLFLLGGLASLALLIAAAPAAQDLLFGANAAQKVGFHGTAPTVQRSSASQTALTDSTGGSVADATLAVVTAPSAVTDSSTGSASTTLAAITSSTPADLTAVGVQLGVIKNAVASLAARQAENRAAIVALTNAAAKEAKLLNELRASLVAKGLIKGGS